MLHRATRLACAKPSAIKFRYFDLAKMKIFGRGGVVRFFMLANSIPFEDAYVPYDKSWPEKKTALIAEGHPSGALPVINIDDFAMSECNAMMRYLARVYGVQGTAKEEAVSDMILDKTTAFMNGLFSTFASGKEEWVKEGRYKHYDVLNSFIEANGGDNWIKAQAANPCPGALSLYCVVKDDATLYGAIDKEYPFLKKLVATVELNTKITQWTRDNYGA
eukprot:TRINITY_DN48464_c0_g1_i1.p2 TRINITY_DN48464_c0_g1~~TRINITY_DN48464_c0_g1_i1.p2  ORF type:complete len:219 (+),score=39.50 TRINITY_DN48464_c0_g1_i1:101-757(+)